MLHVDTTHCPQSMTHLQVLKNLLSAGVVKVVAGGSGSGTYKNMLSSQGNCCILCLSFLFNILKKEINKIIIN